jgi:hypothetical protein
VLHGMFDRRVIGPLREPRRIDEAAVRLTGRQRKLCRNALDEVTLLFDLLLRSTIQRDDN